MENLEGLPNIELSDNTIKLRPFRMEDVIVHLAGDDEEQIKWLGGKKSTTESATNWILKNQQSWLNDGPIYNFAICTVSSEELVGTVEANTDYEQTTGIVPGDANISYAIYPQARGKGYASKAVDLMTSFLMNKGIKRAVIRVRPENTSSVKVAEKSNFQFRGAISIDNETFNIYVKELNT